MSKIIGFLLVFIIGEIVFNATWYRYLKYYFSLEGASENTEQEEASEVNDEEQVPENKNKKEEKKFLALKLSTFKGIFERFIISVGLILNFMPIIIVFGTIKLGTRFDKNKDVKNDYFLIGNLSSILIAIFYHWVLNLIIRNKLCL